MLRSKLGLFFLSSLFLNAGILACTSAEAFSPTNTKTTAFLSLADLHFDPFLSCKKKPCSLIQKLQAVSVKQWEAILAQRDTTEAHYGKDSNYRLLKSAFIAAQKEGQIANAHFVLVLGDFLAHHYDTKYKQYSGDKTQAGYLRFVKK